MTDAKAREAAEQAHDAQMQHISDPGDWYLAANAAIDAYLAALPPVADAPALSPVEGEVADMAERLRVIGTGSVEQIALNHQVAILLTRLEAERRRMAAVVEAAKQFQEARRNNPWNCMTMYSAANILANALAALARPEDKPPEDAGDPLPEGSGDQL